MPRDESTVTLNVATEHSVRTKNINLVKLKLDGRILIKRKCQTPVFLQEDKFAWKVVDGSLTLTEITEELMKDYDSCNPIA